MSIADKLTTIAENQQRVYAAGFVAGQEQGGGGYDEGFTAGQQAQYDRFWDTYQENGNRTQYVGAFSYQGWKAENYRPKYPITGVSYGLQQVFSNSRMPDTIVSVILRGGGDMRATFNYCTYLKRIPSLVLEVPATDLTNTFNQCSQLEEINIECVGDGCFATKLSLQHSSKLTTDSVTSVINALKDLTGATAQTLTLHATVGGKLTDAQKAAITAKNWTLVY